MKIINTFLTNLILGGDHCEPHCNVGPDHHLHRCFEQPPQDLLHEDDGCVATIQSDYSLPGCPYSHLHEHKAKPR